MGKGTLSSMPDRTRPESRAPGLPVHREWTGKQTDTPEVGGALAAAVLRWEQAPCLQQPAERRHLPARTGNLTGACGDQRSVPCAKGVFEVVQDGRRHTDGYSKQLEHEARLAGG